MKTIASGVIVAGLFAWMAADAVRADRAVDHDAPATQPAREIGWAEPGQLGEDADGHRPLLSDPLRDRADRPGQGDFGDRGGRRAFGRRFRGPGFGPQARQLRHQEIEEFMAVLQEQHPELHEKLVRLRQVNPAQFRRMLHRARGLVSEIIRKKTEHPEYATKLIEAHHVEMELGELRRQYHAASSKEDRERIKANMRDQLEKRFDLRLERLRFEIRDFEKRLERAKRQLADRESNKERIIENELGRLVSPGQAEPFEFREHRPAGRERPPGRLLQHPPPPPPER